MILSGNSLGARQRELNNKVKEAADKDINFGALKTNVVNSDVDILFNIDLAIKLKNVDYIVETLKCGDRLHISRALRAPWFYDDEYAHMVNPNYLKCNVFPLMSFKMRNILLTKIALNLAKGDRALDFYNFCIDEKFDGISNKFLLLTPQSFKLQYLEKNGKSHIDFIVHQKDEIFLQHFIENSFVLAEKYVENSKNSGNRSLYFIRHMYSESDVKYLDLVEKYGNLTERRCNHLGLRITKSIMQKFKNRLLGKPSAYFNLLNKNYLIKYSSSEDAKVYLTGLLPTASEKFWYSDFCNSYNYIIDIIPFNERFDYIKSIFCTAYPNEEFETSKHFASNKYYKLMTLGVKENWALRVINEEEYKGSEDYFKWYKFVNFSKALLNIKKIIMVTSNREIRNKLVKVLFKAAKTQRDLEKLFHYYFERHANEICHLNENIVDWVLRKHNVLEFDEKCWTEFHKLLCLFNLNVKITRYSYDTDTYVYISLLYHIVHGLEIEQKLEDILENISVHYNIRYQSGYMLGPEMQDIVRKYIIEYYTNKIRQLDSQTYSDEIKYSINNRISSILQVLVEFNKTIKECPEIVMKHIKLDWDEYKDHSLLYEELPRKETTKSQIKLIRLLKQDVTQFVDELPKLKQRLENSTRDLNLLLRKLKIYFSHDVALVYLEWFKSMLEDKENLLKTKNAPVLGIIQLADTSFKVDFMTKYAPAQPKIDYELIDECVLRIQQAICQFACYSRPPLPLDIVMMYIKGDYTHHSLPMFNMFMANLQPHLNREFITRLLDSPLSILKHGLRLAFNCFSSEDYKSLTIDVWKKTQNATLRMKLYQKLFDKVLIEKESVQRDLFDALLGLTRDLKEDDDDVVFSLATSPSLPEKFYSESIETTWSAVSKLPIKAKNLNRMIVVISQMTRNIGVMKDTCVRPIVLDHVKRMLVDKQIRTECDIKELNYLNNEKWRLTATFIAHGNSSDTLELLRLITKNCFEMWDVVDKRCYMMRNFYSEFMNNLKSKYSVTESYKLIFETILKDIEDALPLQKRYLHVWDLRLNIINFNVLPLSSRGSIKEPDTIKEIILNYSREIGRLVKGYIEQGIFFKCMFEAIVEVIIKQLKIFHQSFQVSWDETKVFAAIGLAETNMVETIIIALQILPHSYEGCYLEDYTKVIEKIQAYEDLEIQCCFYKKEFVPA